MIPIVFTKRRKVRRIVFPKTLPSFACFVQRIYYHGLIHGYACLQYKNVSFSPAWIPVIRLPVCQQVTHPLAYGLLSRNSSTHTPTPTSRTVTLGMNHRGVEANLNEFRSSVRHWMPIVPAKGLSGYSRCECIGRSYLGVFPPGFWFCLQANGFRFGSESPPVPSRGEAFPEGQPPDGGQTMRLGRA